MQPKTRRNTTGAEGIYNVTYTFNGHLRPKSDKAISLIRETVTEMKDEGTDIDFLGATGEINVAGQVIELTARFAAPSEGSVGRLNWRAGLPASGSPRRADSAANAISQNIHATP